MTKQQMITSSAEELVRRVLTNAFGQKPTEAQVRAIAKKVSAVVPKPREERRLSTR